jgi:hypothetical protein
VFSAHLTRRGTETVDRPIETRSCASNTWVQDDHRNLDRKQEGAISKLFAKLENDVYLLKSQWS